MSREFKSPRADNSWELNTAFTLRYIANGFRWHALGRNGRILFTSGEGFTIKAARSSSCSQSGPTRS